jgi:hypothetical protein
VRRLSNCRKIVAMKRSRDEKLLHPKPGSRIAAARDFGIDLTLLVENLRLTPAERLRANDQAINDVMKFEEAVRRAKKAQKGDSK